MLISQNDLLNIINCTIANKDDRKLTNYDLQEILKLVLDEIVEYATGQWRV